ncbi:MAG: OadG family protein [Bacteroidota bacterium]|nr:OadG family protein [Bacteroidota bacterium]
MILNIFNTGISIAITGYIIVFAALAFLYFIFSLFPFLKRVIKNKSLKKNCEKCEDIDTRHITGTEVAAISMAIHLYMNEKHDNESYNMTIKKISKRYSPWNSKIYSMNNLNKKG